MVDRIREEEFGTREERRAPYKTEARGEKEICIAGPRDGVNWGQGRDGTALSQYIGGRGFLLEKTEGVE